MKTLVAFPSTLPGGLEAGLEPHFGHCPVYTLVTLEDGTVGEVQVIPNMPHEQGGCLAPVKYLAGLGVKTLVSGGMGLRPLMGFNQVGIEVYYGGGATLVKEAAAALAQGRLVRFSQEHTCGGGQAHQS